MYIVFEGIDGSGKSTIITALSKKLETLNITPICLYEPTHSAKGLAARKLFEGNMKPRASDLHPLLTQDRIDHVKNKIRPALEFIQSNPKFCLLQDRGYLSAPAYQATCNDNIFPMLKEQMAIAPEPDVFFLIDIKATLAMERINARAEIKSVFDRKDALEEIRQRYLALANSGKAPVKIIDGTKLTSAIVDEISDFIHRYEKPNK